MSQKKDMVFPVSTRTHWKTLLNFINYQFKRTLMNTINKHLSNYVYSSVCVNGITFFFKFLNTRVQLPWLETADVQYSKIVTTIHIFHFKIFIIFTHINHKHWRKTNQLMLILYNGHREFVFGSLHLILEFTSKWEWLIFISI